MAGDLLGSIPPRSAVVKRLVFFGAIVVLALVVSIQREEVVRFVWSVTHWPFLVSLSNDRNFMYHAGTYYMDAASNGRYSLDDAERILSKAIEDDAFLPYGLHQLARISFLRGDFETALASINAELERNPEPSISSYYVRALIKGYMDDFEGAAADYEVYLKEDPRSWAAINDYAWVLIKAGRLNDALIALDWGLLHHRENPWLLNTKATTLFEMGRTERANEVINLAAISVMHVTEADWMRAYPGNDPLIAREGVETFQKSVETNMHTISIALEERTENVP